MNDNRRSLMNGGDPYGGYEYVDLGLPSGLKWAKHDIGVETDTQLGDFFDSYSNSQIDWAVNTWGHGWRTPTYEEFKELLAYTTFNNISNKSGVNGVSFTATNGNVLFFACRTYKDAYVSYDRYTWSGGYNILPYSSSKEEYNYIYFGRDYSGIRLSISANLNPIRAIHD